MSTLFVDESGTFKNDDQLWIVGGLWAEASEDEVETALDSVGQELLAEFKLNKRELHLTELRARFPDNDHERPNTIAAAFLRRVLKTRVPCHYHAVVNHPRAMKIDPDRNYRLMVFDIVALIESSLPPDVPLQSLNLVAASRPMTPDEDLSRSIVRTLEDALPLTFASAGLLDTGGTQIGVQIRYCTDSWALIAADFLTNMIQNRKHPAPRQLIQELEDSGRLVIFESYGKKEERRARVAFRDRDYAGALLRWSQIAGPEAERQLQRAWTFLLGDPTPRAPRAHIEMLLHRLDSMPLTPARRWELLSRLEAAFPADRPARQSDSVVLFRLRNYMIVTAQHRGDIDQSRRLIRDQRRHTLDAEYDPDLLPLMLDEQRLESETAINALEFPSAVKSATKHLNTVESLEAAFELAKDQTEVSVKEQKQTEAKPVRRTAAHIKARMNWLRCRTLAAHNTDQLKEVVTELDDLYPTTDATERGRYFAARLLALLRAAEWEQALVFSREDVPLDDYVLFWKARTAGDCLLAGLKEAGETARAVYGQLVEREERWSARHPHDLLARECGLLCRLLEAAKRERAQGFLARAKDLLDRAVADSPIRSWLQLLNDAHTTFVKDEAIDVDHLIRKTPEPVAWLLIDVAGGGNRERLLSMRKRSPY